MTSVSALAPWLVVLAIAVIGTAAAIDVKEVLMGLLSATTTTDDDADPGAQRSVGRSSEVVGDGRLPDGGTEETVGAGISLTRAGDSLWGYVALGLGFLCLVGLVLLDGVYAEQLTVIGILLYGLVLLRFYEQLVPTASALTTSPATAGSDAKASSGGSGTAGGRAAIPSRTDVSTGSEAADGDGSEGAPERHEAPPDLPGWDDGGTRMPAWGWSRTEPIGALGSGVLVRDPLDGDERTPSDHRDGDADPGDAADTDDPDDSDDPGDTETADGSTRSEFACQYCGRDDFESAPQRNGHLRWCDEYDPNASAADDSEETADAAVASGGAAGTDDGEVTGDADGGDAPGTEPTEEIDGTAETAGDDEAGAVQTLDAGTTIELDATGWTIETDAEEPSDVDVAAVAGTASVDGGGANERGDAPGGAANAPSEGGERSDESGTSSTHTSDEQSVTVPASTVSTARRHLRAGRLDEAVDSAYWSVREELRSRNDLPPHETHREFSAACREAFGDDDSVEALDRLVDLHERLYYADETDADDADRTEIETLLGRLVDTESSRR